MACERRAVRDLAATRATVPFALRANTETPHTPKSLLLPNYTREDALKIAFAIGSFGVSEARMVKRTRNIGRTD